MVSVPFNPWKAVKYLGAALLFAPIPGKFHQFNALSLVFGTPVPTMANVGALAGGSVLLVVGWFLTWRHEQLNH